MPAAPGGAPWTPIPFTTGVSSVPSTAESAKIPEKVGKKLKFAAHQNRGNNSCGLIA
jgi:hypothetical protein